MWSECPMHNVQFWDHCFLVTCKLPPQLNPKQHENVRRWHQGMEENGERWEQEFLVAIVLMSNLYRLEEWSDNWQLKFNTDKRKVMHNCTCHIEVLANGRSHILLKRTYDCNILYKTSTTSYNVVSACLESTYVWWRILQTLEKV